MVEKPVTFIATVDPKAATGTMSPMDGKVVSNCTAVALASGQASCAINSAKTGKFSIVAM